MKQDIYKQHQNAFALVSAYTLNSREKAGAHVASIAFKYPRDGAGRLTCYLHVFGQPMVKGHAPGYGYDKASAAFQSAADKLKIEPTKDDYGNTWEYPDAIKIKRLIPEMEGREFYNVLRDAGFIVSRAV